MRFGKIDYLNLLPFDVFIKQCNATSNFKCILHAKKSYPAKLNREFLFRRIDAGFLSSIMGIKDYRKMQSLQLGIIANKEVWSVLVREINIAKDDQSATSNALSQVLGLSGSVIIGDKALQYFYQKVKCSKYQDETFMDMAEVWHAKTRLPFVFGCMYFNNFHTFYQKIIQDFKRKLGYGKKYKGIKIPHYIMMSHVHRLDISKQFAHEYLARIYYVIGMKERQALLQFYRALRLKRIAPPQRFLS